jgi:hypothetical protein
VKHAAFALMYLLILLCSGCTTVGAFLGGDFRTVNICTRGFAGGGMYEIVAGTWRVLKSPPVDAQAFRKAAGFGGFAGERWLQSKEGNLILCDRGYWDAGLQTRCNHQAAIFEGGQSHKTPRRLAESICMTSSAPNKAFERSDAGLRQARRSLPAALSAPGAPRGAAVGRST